VKKKADELWKKLSDLGISNTEARQYRDIYKGCVLLDTTKGEVHMPEVIDMICDAFEAVVNSGPLAHEPCMRLKVSIEDVKLHEDAIHRGPAQVYPAIRDSIKAGMHQGRAIIFEPIQVLQIEAPLKFMGEITKLVQRKRGQTMNIEQEGDHISMRTKMPVSEMMTLASDLRGATEGRGTFALVDQLFEKLPRELQEKLIQQIRNRKGLDVNQ
jgi:elongation factor 2